MAIPTGTVTFLFSDVEGSTRLWEQSPTAMRAALARHDEILRSTIESRDGYVFSTAGDAFSAAFETVSDGIDAAITAQRVLQAEPCGEVEIRVRMSLHVGEADERDGDYFGPALNRAARILATAMGTELLVSDAVSSLAHDVLPFGAELLDLGSRHLKDIDRAEHVFRITAPGLTDLDRNDADPTPIATSDSFGTSDRRHRSIAVLPFEAIGADPETEAVADGLVNDIITALSAWRHYPVTARQSTFVYKSQAVGVREVARELGVRFVLHGSVRRAGSNLRVTAQLVDRRGVWRDDNVRTVWGGSYEGRLEEIFDFQDRITGSVANVIDPAIVSSEVRQLTHSRPASFDAWENFARGRSLIETMEPDAAADGRHYLAMALEIDEDLAEAISWLAVYHFFRGVLHWADDADAEYVEAAALCDQAIRIDPLDSFAHAILSVVHLYQRDMASARSSAQRSLELNPSSAPAHFVDAISTVYDSDDYERASEAAQRSLELSPSGFFSPNALGALAAARYFLGCHRDAAEAARAAIGQRPGYDFGRIFLVASLARSGDLDQARHEMAEFYRVVPDFGVGWIIAPLRPEQLEDLLDALQLAGMKPESDR